MEARIAGKVALIVVGGNGTGRRAGEILPHAGAAVAITAPEVDQESFDETVNRTLAQGGRAVGAADRTVKEDIDSISCAADADVRDFVMAYRPAQAFTRPRSGLV